MRKSGRIGTALVAAALLVSCDPSQLTEETSGRATLRVVAGEGTAFRLVISGGTASNVTGAGDGSKALVNEGADGLELIVIGRTDTGELARLTVPDRGALSSYTITVQQVAGPDNVLLDPAAHSLRLEPVE